MGQAAVACQQHCIDLVGLAQNSHAFGSQEPGRELVVGRCRLENRMNLRELDLRDPWYPSSRSLDTVWGVGECRLSDGALSVVNDHREFLLCNIKAKEHCHRASSRQESPLR